MRPSMLLLLGLSAVVTAAKEPLEFTAYLTTDGQTRIVLRDTAAGHSSGWLALGESFGETVVGPFHPATETLAVTRGGQPFTLALRSSQVRQVEADRLAAADLERRVEGSRSHLRQLSLRYRSVHPELIKQRQTLAELERQLAALRARG